MKLVKEHINNFERGLVPKKAMNIGLEAQIEKTLQPENSIYKMDNEASQTEIIETLLQLKKYLWIDFLIDNKYININLLNSRVISLLNAAYHENYEAVDYLIKKGFSVKNALRIPTSPISKQNLKNFLEQEKIKKEYNES
ncbi:MAG: hypothetical protein WC554_12870 [Clostridia bacterium]